jgi:hypothetical protein
MLRQQFKQYIHYNHYMPILDVMAHFENMPVKLQFLLSYSFPRMIQFLGLAS